MVEAAAMDIMLPVLESGTVLAAHYAKACGRDCIVAEDIRYGLMYACRNVAGRQLGSIFPEIYEDSDESDDDSSNGDSQSESDAWARYTGTEDETAVKMNECADSWDSWEPENPAEFALKRAIDKQREG